GELLRLRRAPAGPPPRPPAVAAATVDALRAGGAGRLPGAAAARYRRRAGARPPARAGADAGPHRPAGRTQPAPAPRAGDPPRELRRSRLHPPAAAAPRGPGGLRHARPLPLGRGVTAGFMYLRLHGDTELYRSGYSDEALDRWAARIRRWADGGEPADARRYSDSPAPRAKRRDVY